MSRGVYSSEIEYVVLVADLRRARASIFEQRLRKGQEVPLRTIWTVDQNCEDEIAHVSFSADRVEQRFGVAN
jgi:hypothetical protein